MIRDIINSYTNYMGFLNTENIQQQLFDIKQMFVNTNKILFIGNGGSQAICMHMSEDFLKMTNKVALSVDSTALMTCLSNDYGYENAYKEWIKKVYSPGDVVVGISSSGNSKNIINAMSIPQKEDIVTLTAFDPNNNLYKCGNVNLHIPINNYGVAECVHHTALHIVLDSILEDEVKK